jgi:hypothetical protein
LLNYYILFLLILQPYFSVVKRKYYLFLWFLCSLFLAQAKAQPPANVFAYFTAHGQKGSIEIIQDPAIQARFNVCLSQQAKLKGINGYRISIYFGSGQDSKRNAELARANFVARYSDVTCYIKFEYPYFKVYVGDFRTRSDAQKFLNEISYNYPDAFIREDLIQFPE